MLADWLLDAARVANFNQSGATTIYEDLLSLDANIKSADLGKIKKYCIFHVCDIKIKTYDINQQIS